MGNPGASLLSHAARVIVAAAAMLLIGAVIWTVLGWLTTLFGIRSGAVILVGFLLVAITGIVGGTYVSVRYITRNSVAHPVAAAVVLGLFPVGLTFQGDVGLIRVAIVLSTVAIAVVAAIALRTKARPNTSLERTRES